MITIQSDAEESKDGWGGLSVSERSPRVRGWFMQGCSKWR